jgi:hypothetical protein
VKEGSERRKAAKIEMCKAGWKEGNRVEGGLKGRERKGRGRNKRRGEKDQRGGKGGRERERAGEVVCHLVSAFSAALLFFPYFPFLSSPFLSIVLLSCLS